MIEKLSDGTLELSFDDWPERDLNLLSHRRIDVAVLEIGLTEIFLPVGAMHRAIPVSADRATPAGPVTRAKSRLLAVGGQNRASRGLSAGGSSQERTRLRKPKFPC